MRRVGDCRTSAAIRYAHVLCILFFQRRCANFGHRAENNPCNRKHGMDDLVRVSDGAGPVTQPRSGGDAGGNAPGGAG